MSSEAVGTLTGEYDDGSEWKATLGRAGRWSCEDPTVRLLLMRHDPRDYQGPPFPFGVPALYDAAKDLGAKVELAIPLGEMPPGTVY